ncbi:hypothetical protein ACQVNO_23075 [Bacillus paranthracis]|uniref:hypothetical protein n=1 Tax=Bacillus paranthracis TaxID=2026186 RepID=UPI003D651D9D
MQKEYFISGVCIHEYITYRISECSWGYDEYDALVKLMKKNEELWGITSSRTKVPCRIRPTGRTKVRGASLNPFFESSEDAYVKARISEFWVRFSMAETMEELIAYGKQFKEYVDRYQFTEQSVIKMREKYNQQKQLIESGRIKSYTFELTNDIPKGLNSSQRINFYTSKASDYLRARGFRVIQKGDLFEISSTRWHDFFAKEKNRTVTPIELILFWEDKEPRLDEKNAMEQMILNKNSVLSYLGQNNEKNIQEHLIALKKSNIIPFVVKDDIGICSVYVVVEDSRKARGILSEIPVALVEDCTDPFSFGVGRNNDGLGQEFWDNVDNMFEK